MKKILTSITIATLISACGGNVSFSDKEVKATINKTDESGNNKQINIDGNFEGKKGGITINDKEFTWDIKGKDGGEININGKKVSINVNNDGKSMVIDVKGLKEAFSEDKKIIIKA